jgi:16S rRNA (guanine527-N7)-methyltransferase
MPAPLTAEAFARAGNVSRETMARLTAYLDLLRKWNRRINLVGRSTLDDPWRRHFLDSAQLLTAAPPPGLWLDVGSGAGFPGLVCAILAGRPVHLVESDARKAVFLREAARATGAEATVHTCRIEDLPALEAAVISARALAPLDRLLDLTVRFATKETIFLFPKGLDVDDELTKAAKSWKMKVERIESQSDSRGIILKLQEVSHVGGPHGR